MGVSLLNNKTGHVALTTSNMHGELSKWLLTVADRSATYTCTVSGTVKYCESNTTYAFVYDVGWRCSANKTLMGISLDPHAESRAEMNAAQ